jgi:hypothetical protein
MSAHLWTTWHYILEDGKFHNYHCENLKSYIGIICFVIWQDVEAVMISFKAPFQHLPEGLQKMTKTSARTVCQQDEIKLQISLI